MKLTPIEAGQVMRKASEVLDMFPSLAQIRELAVDIKKANFVPKKIQQEVVKKHEWPNSILGLMMGIKERGYASPFGLRVLNLTADEAEYLFQVSEKKNWSDPWALEILAKSKPNFLFQNVDVLKPVEGETV